jgi:hypothetical protein
MCLFCGRFLCLRLSFRHTFFCVLWKNLCTKVQYHLWYFCWNMWSILLSCISQSLKREGKTISVLLPTLVSWELKNNRKNIESEFYNFWQTWEKHWNYMASSQRVYIISCIEHLPLELSNYKGTRYWRDRVRNDWNSISLFERTEEINLSQKVGVNGVLNVGHT